MTDDYPDIGQLDRGYNALRQAGVTIEDRKRFCYSAITHKIFNALNKALEWAGKMKLLLGVFV